MPITTTQNTPRGRTSATRSAKSFSELSVNYVTGTIRVAPSAGSVVQLVDKTGGREAGEKRRALDALLARPLETPAALREFLRAEGPLGEAKQNPIPALPTPQFINYEK